GIRATGGSPRGTGERLVKFGQGRGGLRVRIAFPEEPVPGLMNNPVLCLDGVLRVCSRLWVPTPNGYLAWIAAGSEHVIAGRRAHSNAQVGAASCSSNELNELNKGSRVGSVDDDCTKASARGHLQE